MKNLKQLLYSKTSVLLLLFSVFIHTGFGQELTPEELEAWFEDDSRSLPIDTRDVNDGDLEFLKKVPGKPTLHSENHLIIKASSLIDGWVLLKQCYENLDAVRDAQVVYQYKKMKNLTVVKKEKIEKAWVEGQSVQLLNTDKGATLCVSMRVHNLYKNVDNTYTLANGPYQRKFLDGYYPMHVTLNITYPQDLLKMQFTKPKRQSGFDVQIMGGKLLIDTWFEGKLFTEVRFATIEK